MQNTKTTKKNKKAMQEKKQRQKENKDNAEKKETKKTKNTKKTCSFNPPIFSKVLEFSSSHWVRIPRQLIIGHTLFAACQTGHLR